MHGIGLGLRWPFLEDLLSHPDPGLSFLEISPENYMRRGGFYPDILAQISERFDVLTHGLTMSVGGTDPFDSTYFQELKRFLSRMGAQAHSEHLCWSGTPSNFLHELLPIPFTKQAVAHTVARVKEAQDRLELPLSLENITFYAHLGEPEMSEAMFINEVLDQSNIKLMLDVNNVYVNSLNHHFDPVEFLEQLPLDRVVQLHVAGHHHWKKDDLFVDTNGAPTSDPVITLMKWVIERTGPLPVILERDQYIPGLPELLLEIRKLREAYEQALSIHTKSKGHK